MKKRLSMATTRNKKLENSISSDYLNAKKRLQRERKVLVDAVKYVDTSSTAWVKIAQSQKEFAELIETEGAIDGALHADAAKAGSEARTLHQSVVGAKQTDDVVAMVSHVKALIMEMDDIEGEFKKVETEFNETLRYEKKVGKLASKEKKVEKTNSNRSKLEQARMTYQASLDAIMTRMAKASGKFEAMLQSVQTAFWMNEDCYLKMMTQGSETTRASAYEIADRVAKMDPMLDDVKAVEVGHGVVTTTPSLAEPSRDEKEGDTVTPVPASDGTVVA